MSNIEVRNEVTLSGVKIPKFRSCRRLMKWVNDNSITSRLPADREQIFFDTKKENSEDVSAYVAQYGVRVGRLDRPLENLILAGNPQNLFSYCTSLHRRNEEVPAYLIDNFKGKSGFLYKWAQYANSRLPQHLEDSLCEARFCFMYAREVLRGRLPSHLEKVFFTDPSYAVKYAFEVIRGYAPVKLPEELHSFLVLKSFEQPDNSEIKSYMEASESDPNKTDNGVCGCRPN